MQVEEKTMGYAGKEWICRNVTPNMSPLGETVADFLGDVFGGIYHLDTRALRKVEWDNKHHILFILGWHSLATVDFGELTRIVVLAHDRALRVEISPHTFRHMKLLFHQRETGNEPSTQCPTLEDHIQRIRNNYKGE